MPTGINSEFWNLTQAAAWVVFRSADLVGRFATPNEHGWQPFMMFPSLWPIPEDSEDLDLLSKPIPKKDKNKLEQRAAIYDRMHKNSADRLRTLQGALIRGRIIATGRLDSVNGKMEIISSDEWDTLTFEPPSAYRRNANRQKIYPWTDIRLESTALKKLWPSSFVILNRFKFDWKLIQSIFKDVQKTNPGFSNNELIIEIQGAYEDRFKKKPPSRTSIQRHIKNWN